MAPNGVCERLGTALVAELAAALGRAGLVEPTHAVALENMRARFNHALDITDQGFDAACRVLEDLLSSPGDRR